MSRRVVIAELLQSDVDSYLQAELKNCDSVNKKLGDAFLLQMADSLSHVMKKRAGLKRFAEKLNSLSSYYSQLYPPEFVKGLTTDYTSSPTKSITKKKKS